MMQRRVWVCGLACLVVGPLRAQEGLKEGPGELASDELLAQIREANGFWLEPPLRSLTYTFHMEHPGTGDAWEAFVSFAAPGELQVAPSEGEAHTERVDEAYDPAEGTWPARFADLLHGVSLRDPLNELYEAPDRHEVRVVGEERLGDTDAYVLQIKPGGQPSAEELAQWDQELRRRATHPRYEYEFVPVAKEVEGKQQVVIEATCLHEEGPGWEAIQAAHQENPAEIRWGGSAITAALREYRGEVRPVIVLDGDPDFHGPSPITATTFADCVDNMTLDLTLGEGQQVFDEALYQQLKADKPAPERWLGMQVGCGIWGMWYGYSSGGAQVDQVWVDKATGMVLREEGYRQGACSFTVEYGDLEQAGEGALAPAHVVVTLLGDDAELYPWVFDMRFTVVDGAAWLLQSLEEFQGGQKLAATAEVFDAAAERAAPQ